MTAFAMASLIWIAVSVLAGTALSLIAGTVTGLVSAAALSLGALTALFAYFKSSDIFRKTAQISAWDRLLFILFGIFCLRHIVLIFSFDEGMYRILETHRLFIPMQLASLHYLVDGVGFWPAHPLMDIARFQDFGMDLFTVFFLKIGVSLTQAVLLIAIFLGVIMGAALFYWARSTALAGFLFLAGTAGILVPVSGLFGFFDADLFKDSVLYSMLPFLQFMSHRDLLFALPAGLMLLGSWQKRFWGDETPLPVLVEALFWGVMPLFHLPTFFVLTVLFLCMAVVKGRLKDASTVLLLGGMIALPAILLATDFFRQGLSIFWWQWKGFDVSLNGAKGFLFRFGYFIPWIAAMLLAARRNHKSNLFLACGGLVIFLILLPLEMGPWMMQHKEGLICWSYLLLLPALHQWIGSVSSLNLRRFLFTMLLLPGLIVHVNAYGWITKRVDLIKARDLDDICNAVKGIRIEASFAARPDPDHPLVLCGRRLVTGFNDYLFPTGSDQRARSEKLRYLLAGKENWKEIADELGVRYLFWSELEEKFFKDSTRPWEEQASVVSRGRWGKVYDLGRRVRVSETPPEGLGLKASFFANEAWEGEPFMVQQVDRLQYRWKSTSEELMHPPFSIVFEGEIFIPESGEMSFYLGSNDGSDLALDGSLLIENHGRHPFRILSWKGNVEQGWHSLRVRLVEFGGDGKLLVWRKLPSGDEDYIDVEHLRPFGTGD